MLWSIDSSQKGYPLTSVTWLYRRPKCTTDWNDEFLKLSADHLLLLIDRRPRSIMEGHIIKNVIKPTNKARNIGVTFDNTVTMSFHINNIVKVAFYHLRNIAKIRKYINVTTAEVLVHAFINSKLDMVFTSMKLTKLQSIQNVAARLIVC